MLNGIEIVKVLASLTTVDPKGPDQIVKYLAKSNGGVMLLNMSLSEVLTQLSVAQALEIVSNLDKD